MRIFKLAVLGGALLASSVAACQSVSTAHLKAYTDAFEEARVAGSLLYEQTVPAVQLAQSTSVEPAAGEVNFLTTLGPPGYASNACDLGGARGVPAEILARCYAFAAVTSYNEILLKLAAGDPGVAVRSDLAQLSSILGGLATVLEDGEVISIATTFAGPTAAVVGPLRSIVGEAQKVAAAAAVGAELENGRPLIEEMVQALRADIPHLYDLQRQFYVVRLTGVINGVSKDIYRPAGRLLSRHAPPTSPELFAERSALTTRLDTSLDELEDFAGKPLSGVAGGADAPAYTAAISQELRGHAEELEKRLVGFRQLVAAWRAYDQALGRYGDLLQEVEQTVGSLAANTPGGLFGTDGAASQWVASAVAVRDAARDIDTLLSTNGSPESKS